MVTRAEFMQATGLSRGQMDRAIARAKAAPGGAGGAAAGALCAFCDQGGGGDF